MPFLPSPQKKGEALMKKAAAGVVTAALAALTGCTASDGSEVELKATVETGKLSGQWEVRSDEGFEGGEFGGKPKRPSTWVRSVIWRASTPARNARAAAP